jgi:hypothetical protein
MVSSFLFVNNFCTTIVPPFYRFNLLSDVKKRWGGYSWTLATMPLGIG